MSKYNKSFLSVAVIFTFAILINLLLLKQFAYPLPQAKTSSLSRYAMLDLASQLMGVRRLGSDIAWIQLLQYYGTPEKKVSKQVEHRLAIDMVKFSLGMAVEEKEYLEVYHSGDSCGEEHKEGCPNAHHVPYRDILSHCNRVTDLDPFFYHVYLYGAGALAWNLERPDEAITLLQKGITSMEKYRREITQDVQQPFWQFHLYMSAIIYRKEGEFVKMTSLIETAARQPDCPNMIKTVLANIYQKDGKLIPSLKLWTDIYDSDDPSYHTHAGEKIDELRTLLKI